MSKLKVVFLIQCFSKKNLWHHKFILKITSSFLHFKTYLDLFNCRQKLSYFCTPVCCNKLEILDNWNKFLSYFLTYSPHCTRFGFWNEKKNALREYCVSGTVLMIQVMQNSPTCGYIGQNLLKKGNRASGNHIMRGLSRCIQLRGN